MTLQELLGVMDQLQVVEIVDWEDKHRVGLAGELYMALPGNMPFLANSVVTYMQSNQTMLDGRKRKALEIDVTRG